MKPALIVLMTFFLLSFSSSTQYTLTIKIKDLRNNKGKVHLELLDKNEKQIKGVSKSISKKSCTITIKGLKAGSYGFKYFHDENSNKKLDQNWLGIPKEGYGFSNDAKGRFGPPDHKDTLFKIKANKTVSSSPSYIL